MTAKGNSWLRFMPVVMLLGTTAVYLRGHNRPENLPERKKLAEFPMQLGDWTGADVSIPADVRQILGPGEFIQRLYQHRRDASYLDLFVAYFPSQRAGDTIHSPKHCLPGAGWIPVESGRIELPLPGGDTTTANRWLIAKGPERQVALYWYQAHGRRQASEYAAKFFLVADALRLNRTDGALVRIITPLASSESPEKGQSRAVGFAEQILPLLDEFIPR